MQRLAMFVLILFTMTALVAAQTSGTSGTSGVGAQSGAPQTGTGAQNVPLAPSNPIAGDAIQSVPSGGAPVASDQPLPGGNVAVPNATVGGTSGAGPGSAVTPLIHLETAMPPAGATNATGGVPAGISSSAVGAGQTSGPTTYSVPVVQNPPVAPVAVNPNVVAPGAIIEDMNGLVYGGAVMSGTSANLAAGNGPGANLPAADNRSLAEIAAQYRRNRAVQNARTYTNADIERLSARGDMNIMGTSENVALPQGEGEAEAQRKPRRMKRSPFTPKMPQQQEQQQQQPQR